MSMKLTRLSSSPKYESIRFSGEAGRNPGEAWLYAGVGQLTLAMALGLDNLRSLQKWVDEMLRYVPEAGGESKHRMP